GDTLLLRCICGTWDCSPVRCRRPTMVTPTWSDELQFRSGVSLAEEKSQTGKGYSQFGGELLERESVRFGHLERRPKQCRLFPWITVDRLVDEQARGTECGQPLVCAS